MTFHEFMFAAIAVFAIVGAFIAFALVVAIARERRNNRRLKAVRLIDGLGIACIRSATN